MTKVAYIAGPMRGYPRLNFDAFMSAEDKLRSAFPLWTIHNPARMDLEEGFNPDDPAEITNELMEEWMRRDLGLITESDIIVLLDGWERSEGVRKELTVARACGLTPMGVPAVGPITWPTWDELADAARSADADRGSKSAEEEVRVVSETGGEKGQKPERYDLLPWEALDEVARVYGFGAEKYKPHNWRRGYAWGLSFAAAMRHITQWWTGERHDPESGYHHLAHGVFHLLALMVYDDAAFDYHTHDDRPDDYKPKEEV